MIFDFQPTYILQDLIETFYQGGHHVAIKKDILCQACYEQEEAQNRLEKEIALQMCELVFTVNYYPVLARACFQKNIPYISWQYDSPPNLPTEETLEFPTNRVFFFSRYDAEYYSQLGLEHMYYLPLATNTHRFRAARADLSRYGADISLTGNLYSSVLPELTAIMTPEQKQRIDEAVRAQLTTQGCRVIEEVITDEFVKQICEHFISLSKTAIQPGKRELFYACCSHVTHLERIMLLRLSSKIARTALYSSALLQDERQLLQGVDYRGTVDYLTQMPAVFKSSKINLNPTLRANRTAIPLRALDIMACHAFMITSAQEEFDAYFNRGKEYVCYETLEEAVELIRYYLQHDSERATITKAAYEKVCRMFTYPDRVERMLQSI